MISAPVLAGNKLIAPGKSVKVAKSNMTVSPGKEWNKLSARPGRNSETWTKDSPRLNDLSFYGGIQEGKPLFRERDKKNEPLPKFSASMLPTDIVTMFENSYRIALNTPLITIEEVEPSQLSGHDGVRFTYSFVSKDEEVKRKGEAVAAIVKGKLYLIAFEAPQLHYFQRDIEEFHKLLTTVKI